MNIYFKFFAIAVLLVSGSFLSAETLILDMDDFEDGSFTVETESLDLYKVGDLLDVYEETLEVDGKEYYSEYVDSLVVVEIKEDSIVLETLWYGAHVNLKTGYYLVSSSRSVETDNPDLEKLNEENDRAAMKDSRKSSFHLDFLCGLVYHGGKGPGVNLGIGLNFGYNYLSYSANAILTSLDHSYYDLAYTYGFQINDWFQLNVGGGVALSMEILLTGSSSMDAPNESFGVFLEAGAKLTTRSIIDLSLYSRGYLLLGSNVNLNGSLFIGLRGSVKLLK